MRLGIMQPYFFPYFGHFQLINRCAQWFVFDIVDYQKKSWMNRNRYMDLNGDIKYFSVSVAAKSNTMIRDVKIVDKDSTLKVMQGNLAQFKKQAPNYYIVMELLERVFGRCQSNYLVDLNVSGLQVICDYLQISFKPKYCSVEKFDYSRVENAGDWALEICKQEGAVSYLNPASGKSLFSSKKFMSSGIELAFHRPSSFCYSVLGNSHQDLSILDVILWNKQSVIRENLNLDSVDTELVLAK